jgi:hypothetical protein
MFKYLSLISLLLVSLLTSAQPNIVDAPAQLQKWHGWVLSENPQLNCSRGVAPKSRNCQWHSPLKIDVSSNKIRFSQTLVIDNNSWVGLPGSSNAWPDNVQINQQSIAVMRKNNQPYVYLSAGNYDLTGDISLKSVPLSLLLPNTSTFIDLSVNGKQILQPRVDNRTLLLNQVRVKPAKASDSLNVQVYRLIRDGYPLQLDTQIEINVAGDRRIARIGRVLPQGFELSNVQSKLPLRISENGDMEIQLDAGRHIVYLKARFTGKQQQFSMLSTSHWPQQELWSFIPDRRYRIVDVQGTPIDGNQTGMPQQWKQYSTYLVSAEKGLHIIEKSRGDTQPDTHQLSLQRTLWLDFSGENFITQEKLTGTMGYLDRLSAQQGYQAGRISINQQPTLLTTVNDDQGVEVLPGEISVLSVGQVKDTNLVINPWSVLLNKASMTLHLPPGYSVFAVEGADSVYNDYLSSWSLWEIFIVILFVVILFKQYGLVAGLAGLGYSLIVHKIPDAPNIIVLLVILGLHFTVRLLGEHKSKKYAFKVYQLALILMLVSFFPFAVQQARLSIYPQLEKDYQMRSASVTTANAPMYSMQDEVQVMEMDAQREQLSKRKKLSAKMRSGSNASVQEVRKYINNYQENEVVQTGPGLPNWHWNTVSFDMSGPITQGQKVNLYIIKPWMSRLQNLLSVLLFVLLAFLFMRKQGLNIKNLNTKGADIKSTDTKEAKLAEESSGKQKGSVTGQHLLSLGTLAIAVLLSVSLFSQHLLANTFPSEGLLEQYYQKLNAPAKCQPDCIAINTLNISGTDEFIELNMKVVSLVEAPLRLPIDYRTLRSVNIQVDGQNTDKLFNYKNAAYLLLDEGTHELVIKINVRDLALLDLQFKEVPQITEVSVDAWKVSGLDKRSIRNARIQLRKHKKQVVTSTQKRLSTNVIKPLVRVTRVLNLDLQWSVTTTVSRVAPEYGAINLTIPLIDGESVTSAGFKVRERQVLVDMAAGAHSVSWRSDLEKVSALNLVAKESENLFEVWQLIPSLRWNIKYQGINPIKEQGAQLTWFPIANDQLQIIAKKPQPLEGESITLDAVHLTYTPGNRQAKANLLLNLRASKGGDYPLNLPADITLESILLNGQSIIYALENGTVNLPVKPGNNAFNINWLQSSAVSIVTNTPRLALAGATNIKITTNMPRKRWVMAVQGPLIGPAVLFWGVLLVILGVGFMLGRQSWSALKSWEWMLLGTGIATSFWPITLLVVIWFVVLGKRGQLVNKQTSPRKFQAVQVFIGLLTFLMLFSLIASVANSLTFGSPDMQVVGNGSYAHSLHWYQDAVSELLPATSVISVPMWSYQILMLLWSIWLATALIRWLKWGWANFCIDGAWKSAPKKAKEVVDKKRTKHEQKEDPWSDK